ncbi:MAG: caspase family protein [Thermoanaerobaculia bacterium]|nr:caspase family protein [Thermoanaerobaculia bacterium]MBP9823874.1 caspase family protein [Thermoanaerobaculia bacterium]
MLSCRNPSLTLGALLLLALASATTAPAAEEPAKRWALLVGVSDYRDSSILPLRFAASDAGALAEALLSSPHGGYAPERIRLLAGNAGVQATAARVKEEIELLRTQVGLSDTLFVFVSSHGVETAAGPVLVLNETTVEQVETTGLPVPELFRLLRSLPVKTRMLVLDACHSGMSKGGPSGAMSYTLADALESGATGTAVLSSSRLGQESFESDEFRRGVFTHYLIEALGGAAGVDRDHDGRISLDEAALYTERRLFEWGRTAGRVQQPWLIRTGSASAPIALSLVPEVDIFGARAKSVEAMGTLHVTFKVEPEGNQFLVRAAIRPEGLPPGKGYVSFTATLESGTRTSWRALILQGSPLNLLPLQRLPSRPTQLTLEERLYTPDMTSFVPVRVVEESAAAH